MASTSASTSPRKIRLDVAVQESGGADSREQAKRLILAGKVRVNGEVADKPGRVIRSDATVVVEQPPLYVGRGGLKLAGALDHFAIDPQGMTCLDIGASTGGFTDCLLQRGACKVFAVDVGHGQLHWKLQNDPRVLSLEKVNARHLDAAIIPEPIDLCVMDVSFISLTLVLPPAFALLRGGGKIVALIKPQFEAGREAVPRGGVVLDEEVRRATVEKIRLFVEGELGYRWLGVIASSIVGAEGNQEFLACCSK